MKNLKNLIVMRDWNNLARVDQKSNRYTLQKMSYIPSLMKALLEDHGLKDVHDVLNRGNIKYTFTSNQGT